MKRLFCELLHINNVSICLVRHTHRSRIQLKSEEYRTETLTKVQGGLEIVLEVTVTWDHQQCLHVLERKVKEVEYAIDGDYVDDSKSILSEIFGKRYYMYIFR